MDIRLDTEDDRTIASLRVNEPKFSHFKKSRKNKWVFSKTVKSNVEDHHLLGELIRKYKSEKLIFNFIQKLYRTVPSRQVPDCVQCNHENNHQNFLSYLKEYLRQKNGLQIPAMFSMFWNILNVISLTILIFILSAQISFPECRRDHFFHMFKILNFSFNLIDLVLNFFAEKNNKGKEIKKISEISQYYFQESFFKDFISLLILLSDIVFEQLITTFLSLIMFWKIWKFVGELEKYEYLYITTSTKERYYSIIKVFITNFVIGHILSTILNLMINLDSSMNWHIKNGFQNSDWIERYIWGYYWGTNIMLTVGFGDLSATNYKEALILIFIETFSCITLAYNINTVGSILSELRSSEMQKKKLLKTFKHMSMENDLSMQLQTRIVNFIQESFEIKEAFLYDEYDALIEKLPLNLKSEYRKEANRSLFESIPFVNLLSKKSLFNLAEKVHRKIAHPEEIISKKGQPIDFLILDKGQLDYICKNSSKAVNGKSILKLKASKSGRSKLISLGFIKNKKFNFQLKSLDYSLIYYLSRTEFEECLKQNSFDYQLWCSARDKDEYLLDENEIYECKICEKGICHDPHGCPKMHYIPIKQHVVFKYLNKTMKAKNPRMKFNRTKKPQCILKKKIKLIKSNQNFLRSKYGTIYIEETQKYRKTFQKIKSAFDKSRTKRSLKVLNNGRGETGKITNQQFNDSTVIHVEGGKKNFWNLESDIAYNFSHYMRKYNPDYLDIGFLPHNEFFQI